MVLVVEVVAFAELRRRRMSLEPIDDDGARLLRDDDDDDADAGEMAMVLVAFILNKGDVNVDGDGW